ncbi:hypothetical protein PG996_014998 [Apiospora saccharicola]|uniref:2EXR domain-containing protein n=1 Tax=Apiospora saccharicola TaxID=335842 RepID=A0ABR1TJW1_9PEZI
MSPHIDTTSSQPSQGENIREVGPFEKREFHPFSRALSILLNTQRPLGRFRQPALLHVCNESRNHLLKFHYVKSFTGTFSTSPYQWVNFDVDTVRLKVRCPSLIHAMQYPIQNLLIECRDEGLSIYCPVNIPGMLRMIPSLRKVTLVVLDSYDDSRDDWLVSWAPLFDALYRPRWMRTGRSSTCVSLCGMPEHLVEGGGPMELKPTDYPIKYHKDASDLIDQYWLRLVVFHRFIF